MAAFGIDASTEVEEEAESVHLLGRYAPIVMAWVESGRLPVISRIVEVDHDKTWREK